MKLSPWYRCICGKIHILTFVSQSSTCSCGENLHTYIYSRPNIRKTVK